MKLTKYLICIFSFLALNDSAFAQYATHSVLSDGDIYKLSIENTGIYKMDYSFLSSIEGLNIDDLDPRSFRFYTQNGGIVPQSLTEPRVDDLQEIPVLISGEADGSFDNGDYVLIYLEGADIYRIEGQNIDFEKNVYDTRNYFFLKTNADAGKRIVNLDAVPVSSYSNYTESIRRHENDRLNLLGNFGGTQGSGKNWYGESFANDPEQNFDNSFRFPNLVPGATAELSVRFASRSSLSTSYEIVVNGQSFERFISPTNTGNIESWYARLGFINQTISLDSKTPQVRINYRPSTGSSEAWLDYIQMISAENLNYQGSELPIFRRDSGIEDAFGYEITTDSQLRVWDVTHQHSIEQLASSFDGSQQRFSYSTGNQVRKFIAFDENEISKAPKFETKLPNQDLHAILRADLAIVYYKDFMEAAEKLANHRRQHSQMQVVAVDISAIYNEFGGGKADPAALRDFTKMLYDRDPNFRYLLLMGDASYDFRGLNTALEFQNFVPTYETDESLDPIEAFPSDDFFALLSNNEGDDSLDGAIDIGVGRIPCKTLSEANGVVNKIINYDTSADALGEWRMRIGFAADDEDNTVHMRQADGIARITEDKHPELIQQKVYFDAYNQESTPGGARYPDARDALYDNLQKGQLVLNYLGHGGPKGWAQERVLQLSDISNLRNFERLPILVTATCSFTGFDEPSVVSAGELALLNPSGGAVALFSTVRAVYSSQNERITREVFEKLFSRSEGQRLTFGDIIRQAQNENSSDTISSNTRKFMLFGDPSQTIALPLYDISIETFNGSPVSPDRTDTLGALSIASIEGSVRNFSGDRIEDFNGEVFLTVFDKSSNLKTLDNDNTGRTFEFQSRKNVLYKGNATVESGRFELEFIIPKDIDFKYGEGQLNLYATDGISRDAGGYYDKVVIGGTSGEGLDDNEGPEISIYFNDRSFESGDTIGGSSLMIVDLSDENGINLSSTSIGHDITAVFDNDINAPLILNEFYTPATNQLGSGTVVYDVSGLEPGLHTVRVKAWDILNNSSEAMVEFEVTDAEDGFIKNVKAWPNPSYLNSPVTYSFEHDLVNTNIDITVEFYDLSGRYLTNYTQSEFAGSAVTELKFAIYNNMSFSNAKYFNQGMLIYKIIIRSEELNLRRESNFEKLMLVR